MSMREDFAAYREHEYCGVVIYRACDSGIGWLNAHIRNEHLCFTHESQRMQVAWQHVRDRGISATPDLVALVDYKGSLECYIDVRQLEARHALLLRALHDAWRFVHESGPLRVYVCSPQRQRHGDTELEHSTYLPDVWGTNAPEVYEYKAAPAPGHRTWAQAYIEACKKETPAGNDSRRG